MTYEEYAAVMDRLTRRMNESKLEEAQAKARVREACTMRHKELKMNFALQVNLATTEAREKAAEIHRIYADERSRLYAQGRDVAHRYQQEHGITPPPMGNRLRRAA